MERGLVTCEWLGEVLSSGAEGPPIRLVDATWYLPNSPFAAPEGSAGAQEDFLATGPRLPGAVFFDIDAVAERHPNGVPHMLPSEDVFSAAMAALCIERDTRVVVYDRHGMFSAPRFWYTLKVVFQHPGEVAVLDGGLPRWQSLGYPIEVGAMPPPPAPAPVARWSRSADASWDMAQVLANIDAKVARHVDARPAARFTGSVPEPRAGMRGGHVPGSISVPFLELLTSGPERKLLPVDDLRARFDMAGLPVDDAPPGPDACLVVTSCGSGLTACIVCLAMHQLGMPFSRMSLYDGSWAEWGAQADTPIVRQGADGTEEPVP